MAKKWKIILPLVLIVPLIIITIVLIVLGVQGSSSSDESVIETQVGSIRGIRATDGDYYMYLGVPYAKIDAANPFGPSTPHPRFDDIFEANNDSAECPQISQILFTPVGTLDCLNLNIYVPMSARSRNSLSVLVWIHGGGFVTGSGNRFIYGPKFIVRHDVILVSVNYRLGPYGFMCLDIPEVPGNQGLKDQLLALKWVKENIDAFGGDVNRITIFGESAGGMSVDLHMYSSEEKLYNNIIMQSGTALLSILLTDPNPGAVLSLAERLGNETTDVREAVSFLSTVDTNLVLEATRAASLPFYTCVEREFDNVERFIQINPINQNILPKAAGIQILVGYNDDEMLVDYVNRPAEAYTGNEFRNTLGILFDFDNDTFDELEPIIRHFYVGGEEIGVEQKFELADFVSDISFVHPTERSIDKYVENGAEKIYYYVFSYVGERNLYRYLNGITVGGANHADELGYLFDISLWSQDPTPEDQLIIDRMTTMWANFAKYGDPTPDSSDLLPVKWEPITSGSPHYYLSIDSELSLGRRPFHHRVSFWDLFYKYNSKWQRGFLDDEASIH